MRRMWKRVRTLFGLKTSSELSLQKPKPWTDKQQEVWTRILSYPPSIWSLRTWSCSRGNEFGTRGRGHWYSYTAINPKGFKITLSKRSGEGITCGGGTLYSVSVDGKDLGFGNEFNEKLLDELTARVDLWNAQQHQNRMSNDSAYRAQQLEQRVMVEKRNEEIARETTRKSMKLQDKL